MDSFLNFDTPSLFLRTYGTLCAICYIIAIIFPSKKKKNCIFLLASVKIS